MKGDFNIYGISEDWRKWESGQTIREIRKNGNDNHLIELVEEGVNKI